MAAQAPRLVLASRDEARLLAIAEECRGKGADVRVVPTDVTSREACLALIQRARDAFSRIDALVLNAGIGMLAAFEDVRDPALFGRIMDVNYLGAVYPTYYALPALKEARGQIVVVSSLAGLTGVPLRTGYAASKHALFGFFESLRIELRKTGVAVTIVAPDFVVSEIHERALGADGKPTGSHLAGHAGFMTAEECALGILRAMERRQRTLVMSFRGRAGRIAKVFAPGLIDRVALRAAERGR
jgi:short-subunit dehydrogenase